MRGLAGGAVTRLFDWLRLSHAGVFVFTSLTLHIDRRNPMRLCWGGPKGGDVDLILSQ